jgi:hypothetical protein
MGGFSLWIMGGHREPMKDYKYEPDEGQLTDEQYAKIKEYEYELDKSTGELVKKYTHEQMVDKMLQNPEVLREYARLINNGEFKKVKALDYSPEFTYWFERIYCQSPRMASLEYDDEKMWEAWKAAKEYGIKEL